MPSVSIPAIIGAVASGVGAIGSGVASAQAASYQAQVARNNATIAAQNERYSAAATAQQVENAGLKARQESSGTVAAAAANNLDTTTGSPVDVLKSERELGFQDVLNTDNRGAQQVYGYATQQQSFTGQAALDQSEVGGDILGGILGGVGKIAGSVSDLPIGGGGNPNSSDNLGGSVDSLSDGTLSGAPSVPDNYGFMGGNETFASADFIDQ